MWTGPFGSLVTCLRMEFGFIIQLLNDRPAGSAKRPRRSGRIVKDTMLPRAALPSIRLPRVPEHLRMTNALFQRDAAAPNDVRYCRNGMRRA